jgi:Xaa-Pro aminopeptidase
MKTIELNLTLQEKERRWSAVREKMAQQGLVALIVYGDNVAAREVACRYLTNMSIDCNCKHFLLFPVDRDPVLLVAVSSVNVFFSKRLSWVPAQNITRSFNQGADLVKHLISLNLHNKRIGIESPRDWPAGDYNTIRESCPGIELVDATPLLTEVRRQKSREELGLMEEAIRIGELAQLTFRANIKEGLREEEVVGKVEDVIRANGVERRFWLICSSPELPYPWVPGDAIIRRPNPVAFSAEFQRTRGYACQVVRTFCWEEPKGEYKRMWDLWKELRHVVLTEFRPGRSVVEVSAKLEDMVSQWGFECDYLGHGLGVSIFDAPAFNAKQEREGSQVLKPNEVIVFHPMIKSKGGKGPLAWVADMYLTGEKETKWMTPFLPGLPEMIP